MGQCQSHYDADNSKNIAKDEGSLLETIIAIVILSIAAFMVVNFTFVSTRAERRFALQAEAFNTLEEYSAGFRGIDCIQHFAVLEVPCHNGKVDISPYNSNNPNSRKGTQDQAERDPVKLSKGSGTGTGITGHALIEVEWKDYYWLEDCENPDDGDIPRAVREITVRWDDGAGADDKEFTRLIKGPTIPHHWGWVYNNKSPTPPLDDGAYSQEIWDYQLIGTTVQAIWATTYTFNDSNGATTPCNIVVGPSGQLQSTNRTTTVTCKLEQGENSWDGDPAATPKIPAACQ
ncbi:MAG: hypothetical protein OXI96_00650 [Acidimicrobiaceae bacterium]|nr:hypothetical protein [Acidimicrobiaceae bacterium]